MPGHVGVRELADSRRRETFRERIKQYLETQPNKSAVLSQISKEMGIKVQAVSCYVRQYPSLFSVYEKIVNPENAPVFMVTLRDIDAEIRLRERQAKERKEQYAQIAKSLVSEGKRLSRDNQSIIG